MLIFFFDPFPSRVLGIGRKSVFNPLNPIKSAFYSFFIYSSLYKSVIGRNEAIFTFYKLYEIASFLVMTL